MTRRIPGLSTPNELFPEGTLLATITRVVYVKAVNPYFAFTLRVDEPAPHANKQITTRLYCTPKAMWKLRWFLRDFRYDEELFAKDEIDEKHLIGLRGVIKASRCSIHGRTFTQLEAFAPATEW